jgi:hypothetical protein
MRERVSHLQDVIQPSPDPKQCAVATCQRVGSASSSNSTKLGSDTRSDATRTYDLTWTFGNYVQQCATRSAVWGTKGRGFESRQPDHEAAGQETGTGLTVMHQERRFRLFCADADVGAVTVQEEGSHALGWSLRSAALISPPSTCWSQPSTLRTRLRRSSSESRATSNAGVALRDVQGAASHADPRTTMRYDRGRQSLDRRATYIVAAFVAGASR